MFRIADFLNVPEPKWVTCDLCGVKNTSKTCWECRKPKSKAVTGHPIVAEVRRRLPAAFQTASLDDPASLRTRVSDPNAVRVAKRAVNASKVVLVGPSGIGKTTLVSAMALARAQSMGLPAWWASAPGLSRVCAEHPLGCGEHRMMSIATGPGLLLFDDVGNETVPVSQNRTPDVMIARYDNALPTWVTTGLDWGQMANRLGENIARRVYEGAQVIELGKAVRAVGT